MSRGVYGKAFGTSAASLRVYMINDPDMIKHVTATNFSNYEKGAPFIAAMESFLGQGIFNSNGPAWKHQRNISKAHFQREDIAGMITTFNKHGAVLASILGRAADLGEAVEVQDLFQKFTLDSVGDILFSYEFKTLTSDSQFAKSFDYLQQESLYRLRNPLWVFTAFLKQQEYGRHLKIVHGLVEKIVQTCLTDPKLSEREDLLAHFVQSKDDHGQAHSIPFLRDVCLNFLLAGRVIFLSK